jgi:hypothetical protein
MGNRGGVVTKAIIGQMHGASSGRMPGEQAPASTVMHLSVGVCSHTPCPPQLVVARDTNTLTNFVLRSVSQSH